MPVLTRSQSKKLENNNIKKNYPLDEKSCKQVSIMEQPKPANQLIPNYIISISIRINNIKHRWII